jgi:hypothetical protein
VLNPSDLAECGTFLKHSESACMAPAIQIMTLGHVTRATCMQTTLLQDDDASHEYTQPKNIARGALKQVLTF